MVVKNKSKCPYCGSQLSDQKEQSNRQQYNHQRDIKDGKQCTKCDYEQYVLKTVRDRSGAHAQIGDKQRYETIPSGSMIVVRGDDRFIQNSVSFQNQSELKSEIKRAEEYREEAGHVEFYLIVVDDISRTIKIEDNYFDGDDDLVEVADYKLTDDGLEILKKVRNDA